MEKVEVILDKQLNVTQKEILEQFKQVQQAMITKDETKLNQLLNREYTLMHMSGKTQTKKEYIEDIMNNTLNYYKSTITHPQITVNGNHARLVANVTLDAKVYGIKGVWTLHTIANFEKIGNKWSFTNWDN